MLPTIMFSNYRMSGGVRLKSERLMDGGDGEDEEKDYEEEEEKRRSLQRR